MNKKTLTKVSERYEAPSLEVLSVSMEGVLCQSQIQSFGEPGAAGAAGSYEEESGEGY